MRGSHVYNSQNSADGHHPRTATHKVNQAARLIPAAPPPARHALLSALRNAHSTLLTPPPIVASDPARLARWRPRVRRVVDWESVEEEGGETGVRAGEEGGTGASVGERRTRRARGKGMSKEEDAVEVRPQAEDTPAVEPGEGGDDSGPAPDGSDPHAYLTVGLIGECTATCTGSCSQRAVLNLIMGVLVRPAGQPNVGKSSLLNALLGRKVVRASRTPGKTKTLQVDYARMIALY